MQWLEMAGRRVVGSGQVGKRWLCEMASTGQWRAAEVECGLLGVGVRGGECRRVECWVSKEEGKRRKRSVWKKEKKRGRRRRPWAWLEEKKK